MIKNFISYNLFINKINIYYKLLHFSLIFNLLRKLIFFQYFIVFHFVVIFIKICLIKFF